MGCGTKEGVAGRFARLGCANIFYFVCLGYANIFGFRLPGDAVGRKSLASPFEGCEPSLECAESDSSLTRAKRL